MKYTNLGLYIDGEWLGTSSGGIQPVSNPADDLTLGELPLAGVAELDRALDAASRGFALWRRTSAHDRYTLLRKVALLVRERHQRMAELITLDQGKPLAESLMEGGLKSEVQPHSL